MEKHNTGQRNRTDTDGRENDREQRNEHQQPRRNPRLVIGNLDYFELLMEQDEQ